VSFHLDIPDLNSAGTYSSSSRSPFLVSLAASVGDGAETGIGVIVGCTGAGRSVTG
jgi:hypothetical protein